LIEKCRRQQHKQKLGIPNKQPELPLFDSGHHGEEISQMFGSDDLTIADIEEEEAWQEHTRERRRQLAPRSATITYWQGIPRELTTVYYDVSDFMMTLRLAASAPWASEEEALEEWRSRTVEDWGFARNWIEA
jgi:hypothetical protein